MTRMEKYKDYRQEIAQSAKLGQSIVNADASIARYEREINKINPAILSVAKPQTLTFVKGVTEISLKQKEIPLEVSKMFSTLNKAKSTYNQENVSLILFNMTNNTILDSNDHFKESWLKQNPDYATLSAYRIQLNLNPNQFEKDLEQKYAYFVATNDLQPFEKFSNISKQSQKHTSSYAFAISIAVAIIFALITFALLIVKMVG